MALEVRVPGDLGRAAAAPRKGAEIERPVAGTLPKENGKRIFGPFADRSMGKEGWLNGSCYEVV
jgi:hypothetical protein